MVLVAATGCCHCLQLLRARLLVVDCWLASGCWQLCCWQPVAWPAAWPVAGCPAHSFLRRRKGQPCTITFAAEVQHRMPCTIGTYKNQPPAQSGQGAGSTIGSTFGGPPIVHGLCSDCAQIVRMLRPDGRNVRGLCCDCATSTAVILCCGLCFASSLDGGGRFLNFSIVFWFGALKSMCRVPFFRSLRGG